MDALLGQIKLFPYDFIPNGWARCAGATIQVSQAQALYSLIGNNYGGSYPTTFALPDLRGAEPQTGMVYCIAITGLYPQRP